MEKISYRPLIVMALLAAFRWIDFVVLSLTHGGAMILPDLRQTLLAVVLGGIAAAVELGMKRPLAKSLALVAVPTLLGPLFLVISVALQSQRMVPAIEALYGFMTVEWGLDGLALATAMWPLTRRLRTA